MTKPYTVIQAFRRQAVDRPRFALGDSVFVADIVMDSLLWEPGEICGVTFQQEPLYSVRLADGTIIQGRQAKELRAAQFNVKTGGDQ